MNKLDELKKNIDQVMQDNKPKVIYNSESDKKIRELELELTQLQLKSPFSVNLKALTNNESDPLFCNGQFKESQYALEWSKWSDNNYRLILRNIPYNNPKLLLTLPENYKESIAINLEVFCEKLKQSLKP